MGSRSRIVVWIVLLIVAGGTAHATGSIEGSDTSIVPDSIPVDGTGGTLGSVGMLRVEVFESADSTANRVVASGVTVNLTGDIAETDITTVRVLFETQGDFDSDGTADNDGILGSDADAEQELVTATFTGGTATLTFPADQDLVKKSDVANGNGAFIYVLYDIAHSTPADRTVGADVQVDVAGFNFFNQRTDATLPSDTTFYSSTITNVDDYDIAVTGSFVGAADRRIDRGDSEVVFDATFSIPDASLAAADYVTVERIRLQQVGTAEDSDFATTAVTVILDSDNDGVVDGGEPVIGTAGMSGGYADVTLSSPTAIGGPGTRFLVRTSMSPTAVINRTIGLRIENPSVDIDFVDGIDDPAAVPAITTQYDQSAVIVATAPTPDPADTYVISEFVPPQVSASSPAAAETGVLRGANVTVTFNENMDAGTVTGGTFSLVEDPDGTPSAVAGVFGYNDASNTITFNPDANLTYSAVYEVTVTATVEDEAGNTLDGNGNGTIEGTPTDDYVFRFTVEPPTPPQVASTTPANGATTVPRDQVVQIVFNEPMEAGTVIAANFQMEGASSGIIADESGFIYTPGTNTLTFTPATLLTYGDEYTVTLAAASIFDAQGTSLAAWTGGGDYSFSFTVDPNEFRVVTPTAPADGSTGISRASNITVSFNDDIAQDEATLSGLFTVTEDPDGTPGIVNGAFSFDAPSNTITFNPTALLSYDTVYEVTLDGSIANTMGSLLSEWSVAAGQGGDYSFRFTVDPVEFRIVSQSPAAGEIGVSRSASIVVVFNEAVNPASVDVDGTLPDSIELRDAGTNSIAGTATFDGTSELRFTPSGLLNYSEVYTVTIDGNLENAIGGLLSEWSGAGGGDYTFSFTVQPPTPPSVINTIPAADATGVDIGSSIIVVFSEAMVAGDLENDANVVLTGPSGPVGGTRAYNTSGFTLTFTPDEDLGYRSTYTLSISGAVRDAEGSALSLWTGGGDYTLEFQTENEFPTFAESIVTNNRIVPGSNEPIRIFVVPPSAERAADEVTVRVFTSTGRRVATLTQPGTTFADLGSQDPVVWDGTNGRGQQLGPGLYFVQITSGSFERSLRVMIVR